jgi:NAD(P)H-dependent FMN reductase
LDDINLFVPVLSGTARAGSRTSQIARILLSSLGSMTNVRAELLDIASLDLLAMRARMSEAEHVPSLLQHFADTLLRADGLVIVAPEYKGGYPGSLKNFLDYLGPGIFRRRPIGIVTITSGGFGGLNCLGQLRQVCMAMGGSPIPTSLPVSKVDELFDEKGELRDSRLLERLVPFLQDFLWYTRALTRQRQLGLSTPSQS